MENKDFDKFFKDTFKNAEQDVNPQIWHNIENELDRARPSIVPIQRKQHSWIVYAAALALLVGFGAIYMLQNGKVASTEQQPIIAAHIDVATGGDSSKSQHTSTTTKLDVPAIALISQEKESKKEIKKNENTERDTNKDISEKENVKIALASIVPTESLPKVNNEVLDSKNTPIKVVQVTEVEPIKPLVTFDEEPEEGMYAAVETKGNTGQTVVTSILNTLSENIDNKAIKELRFRADDEGSILIDIVNTFAKNRNKKRK